MHSRLGRKTLSLLLCLTLAAGAVSCTKKDADPPEDATETVGTPEAEEASGQTEPAGDEAEEEAFSVPEFASKLADYSWALTGDEAAGFLIFDGGTAELKLLADGEDRSVSGPVSFSEKTMTIGDRTVGWAVVASFCRLTVDGVGYSFRKAENADAARGPFLLLTGSWEGEGASLSFDGKSATLTIDGEGNWTGEWELSSDGVLSIHDDAQGEAGVNLASGAKVTASSQETADFPAPLAADGDYGTRWSSEYVDPSWLLLDLGSEKTVGAAVVCFETACSSDFRFETSSDGVSFTEAASVEGNVSAGIGAPVTVLFREPIRCRYVRFVGLSRATQWGHSIYELELYAAIAGEAECTLEFHGQDVKLTRNGKTYTMGRKG